MSLPSFLTGLFTDGRVGVPPPVAIPVAEAREAADLLHAREGLTRSDTPGDAPPFSAEAGIWAASRIYHACQFISYRDAGTDLMRSFLSGEPDDKDSPSVLYSVDLTMRFLPDLLRLARSASEEDPLVERLLQWARDWPLSSVGVRDVGEQDVNPIAASDCLLRQYRDRIIARDATDRLGHPVVRDAVAAALGVHRRLAPKIAAALENSP